MVIAACRLAAEANLSKLETVQLFNAGGPLGPQIAFPSSTTSPIAGSSPASGLAISKINDPLKAKSLVPAFYDHSVF